MTIKQAVQVLKEYNKKRETNNVKCLNIGDISTAHLILINHLLNEFAYFNVNFVSLKHGKKGSNTKKGAEKEVKRQAKKAPKQKRKR